MRSSMNVKKMRHSIIDKNWTGSLVLALLLGSCVANAQSDTVAVRDAVLAMEKALTGNDTSALKQLLHPDLTFGHSNGWIQNKQQVIGDMASGYLRYISMQPESLSIEKGRKRAIVKEFVQVSGQRGGTPFQVRLFVLQEWIHTTKGWQLLVRQGAKQG